ncbi:hypothetical protein GCM10011490_21930 [Pseudoclavibacter endophyticus]|nr:hypothetical protein GCM10011490_21930 [Pseudoclavibacter endophyticus]
MTSTTSPPPPIATPVPARPPRRRTPDVSSFDCSLKVMLLKLATRSRRRENQPDTLGGAAAMRVSQPDAPCAIGASGQVTRRAGVRRVGGNRKQRRRPREGRIA